LTEVAPLQRCVVYMIRDGHPTRGLCVCVCGT